MVELDHLLLACTYSKTFIGYMLLFFPKKCHLHLVYCAVTKIDFTVWVVCRENHIFDGKAAGVAVNEGGRGFIFGEFMK